MSLMPVAPPFFDAPYQLVAVSTNGAYPTVQDNDRGILLECLTVPAAYPSADAVPALTLPPGFVTLFSGSNTFQQPTGTFGAIRTRISQQNLVASLSGTSIGSVAQGVTLLVFRHPRNRLPRTDSVKPLESTPTFSGGIQFGSTVSPQTPLFFVTKRIFTLSGGSYIPGVQPFPTVLFDGVAGTNYGASSPGAIAQVSFLAGALPPRLINVSLDAANPNNETFQYTAHQALSLRRNS